MTPEAAPPIPPVTALKTLARVAVFVRPYGRQVIYAAIALVVAAAAVLAVGQGLKGVVDRGFGMGNAGELESHAGTDARRHRRDGCGNVLAVLLRLVDRRAGQRDLRRRVRPYSSPPPGFYEAIGPVTVISRLIDRHHDAADRDWLVRLDRDPQRAYVSRRAGDAGDHQREVDAAGDREVPAVVVPSFCSGAGCATVAGEPG